MNRTMLIGRLGKDPELRYTANGSPIANLRIATDESYTDKDGNKIDRTEWHTVVVFQRQAENCERYLKKGSLARGIYLLHNVSSRVTATIKTNHRTCHFRSLTTVRKLCKNSYYF